MAVREDDQRWPSSDDFESKESSSRDRSAEKSCVPVAVGCGHLVEIPADQFRDYVLAHRTFVPAITLVLLVMMLIHLLT